MARTKISTSSIDAASITSVELSTTAVVDSLGFTPVQQSDIDTAIDTLVDAAPGTLNTLNEIAAALNDDPNVISTLTPRTASTGSTVVPSGTSAQRDASPSVGYIRFNSDLSEYEGYDGTTWGGFGGGGYDSTTITTNTTLDINTEYETGSGLSIDAGITLTVPVSSILTVKYYGAGKVL